MSLYRKYRPQKFADLVGQHYINQTLLNAVQSERINHAYLFTGPRGTGKTSTARILAKAINCLNLQQGEPCNVCEICKDIQDGRLIDLIEIDAASNRGIDEIRDLKEKIQFAPTRARSKVYIIDEVHMLTKEAFNALLKTLEEPPPHVYFILATTEVHKIPETILSRCQRFDFRRIEDEMIIERLQYIADQEGIKAEVKALEVIARQSQGGLRDAIGLLEQLAQQGVLSFEQVCATLGVSNVASIEHLYNFLEHCQINEAIQEIHELYKQGYDLVIFHKSFLEFLRQQMLKNIAQGNTKNAFWHLQTIENFRETYDQVKQTIIPELPLELAIVKTYLENTAITSSDIQAKMKKTTQTDPPQITDPAEHQSHSQSLKKDESKKVDRSQTVAPTPESPKTPSLDQPIHEEATIDISFERLQEVWPRIVEHVSSAVAKRTLQIGKLLRLEGTSIIVGFPTKFHYEKMMETANRVAVEEAASRILTGNFKLVGEVNSPVQPVKNIIEPERTAQSHKVRELNDNDTDKDQLSEATKKQTSSSLAEEALKIFEGGIME